mgnify:CR=1 FL=1|tara:strand:+ start:95 stop:709 length:615 start_codon:yes stop_codon:yes gene_type:complete
MNLSEQEKNRIRGLHGMNLITEQDDPKTKVSENPPTIKKPKFKQIKVVISWPKLPRWLRNLFIKRWKLKKKKKWMVCTLASCPPWETESEEIKTNELAAVENEEDQLTEATDYSDEEGVTLTIDKGFDYEGDMSRTQIIDNLWQVQGLLQECSPAIALARVVEILSRLGEKVSRLDRDFGDCNCDGGGTVPKNIDEILRTVKNK